MDAPASPRPRDTFLHEFGTPILLDICQRCGDELTGGPAASIPSADPAAAEWK